MALPEKFTYPFSYTPHPLVREAAESLILKIRSNPRLHNAFSEGKMLGVMLVSSADASDDEYSVLYAFSGNVTLDGIQTNNVESFVPPVYDLLDNEGHYRQKEAEISELNLRIYKLEKSLRKDSSDSARGKELEELRIRRRALSEYLQKWIFDKFVLLNAKGETRSLTQLAEEKGSLPPGGTAECALPRMLQYAYSHNLRPRAFGEFWYGASKGKSVRTEGAFYPSCTSKCGFILPFMLDGLDVEDNPDGSMVSAEWKIEDAVVYEDDCIILLNKPSGILSVPGKDSAQPSLLALLQRRSNLLTGSEARKGPRIYPVHRLDMDTSGLILFVKSSEYEAIMRSQFEGREVSKTYIARLSASSSNLTVGSKGRIELPLAADFLDRPRQVVDFENGKVAVTDYEVLENYANGEILVRYFPKTGRTHQLRVHSAHSLGLSRPICGDRLYGDNNGRQLCLMAESMVFSHPLSGERMEFRLDYPDWAL